MHLSIQSFALFTFVFLFGLSFQLAESYPQNEVNETVSKGNSTLGLFPRDDDDDLEEKRRKVLGVGDIILGAFAFDLKKIINGAFSFVQEDVRNNVLGVILGSKPPTVEPSTTESPSTLKPHKNGTKYSIRKTSAPETIDVRTKAPVTEAEEEDEEESED